MTIGLASPIVNHSPSIEGGNSTVGELQINSTSKSMISNINFINGIRCDDHDIEKRKKYFLEALKDPNLLAYQLCTIGFFFENEIHNKEIAKRCYQTVIDRYQGIDDVDDIPFEEQETLIECYQNMNLEVPEYLKASPWYFE